MLPQCLQTVVNTKEEYCVLFMTEVSVVFIKIMEQTQWMSASAKQQSAFCNLELV